MSSRRTVVCHARASNAKQQEKRRDRDEPDRRNRGPVASAQDAHAGASTASRAFHALVPGEEEHEQDAEREQRPRRLRP